MEVVGEGAEGCDGGGEPYSHGLWLENVEACGASR